MINNTDPSDADLKQLYVYNQYWNVEKSILLYPQVETVKESFGKYHKGIMDNNFCKLGFIHILKDSELDDRIGEVILEKLKSE